MKATTIISVLLSLFFLSCTDKKESVQKANTIESFSKDSVMQKTMYSVLDTANGLWVITISEEEAMKRGVSSEVYQLFEENIQKVNFHIDSIRKENPNVSIGYNFPDLKE